MSDDNVYHLAFPEPPPPETRRVVSCKGCQNKTFTVEGRPNGLELQCACCRDSLGFFEWAQP